MATTASPALLDQNVSKFVSKTQKMLINGKWVEAASGKTFPTLNPATGDILSRVAEGDKEDIDRAVKAAPAVVENHAFRAWPHDLETWGLDRKAPGRIRAVGIARQWQASYGCACRRRAS